MSRCANAAAVSRGSEAAAVPNVLDALTHGWPGLALAYGAVQAPMLVGMARAEASARRLLLSPVAAAPLTAVAGAAMALASPLLRELGASAGGMIELAAATGLSAGIGYFAGRILAHGGTRAAVHQRGALIASPRAPRELNAARSATSPSRSRAALPELTLAGVTVPRGDETKHFKLIGATGTGKSTAITELLAAALARGDRAVIADPDAGYLRRLYDARRGDLVLNPFEPGSMRWDLFGEIRANYDVEQLARSLIPDHEGSDRSWRGYARTFFTAVTRQARGAGVSDVEELYRLLVVADARELRTLIAGTPAHPFLDEHNSRMFDSIRSVTSSAVGALEYIAAQDAAPLSLRGWVQSQAPRGGVLFMPYRAGQIAALRSVVSAWMRIAIFEAMEHPEQDQRLWFVVDELDALGQIDGLKDALARVRKFGGRCVLGFQSIAQVAATYGAGEAHTIVENCGNTLILRCSASEGGGTSKFASALIGQREVLRTTRSRSRRATELFGSTTLSEHVNIEPAVMGSEIEQLPDLAGYLKLASYPAWLRVRVPAMSAAPDPPYAAPSTPPLRTAGASMGTRAPRDLHEPVHEAPRYEP